jgi:RND superfamily putative drug exporter
MSSRPVTVKVASWSAAHPWRAIVGWFVFVIVCLGAASLGGDDKATTADYRVGQAGRAEAMAAGGGLELRPTEQVVIDSASGKLDPTAARAAANDITQRMRDLPQVAQVATPVVSKNGTTVRVQVVMTGEELAASKIVGPLVAQTAAVQKTYPDLRVQETGSPSMSQGLNQQRDKDLTLSEEITLPLTVITLLIAFGSVLSAGIPVLLALSSIAAAMGLGAVASHAFPDVGVGNNIILLIGMAVGIDYSLFYLKRDREERARSGGRLSSEAVVELAASTAGHSIVVSGFAVILSTATLYLATDVIFSSLATDAILVVLVAIASSLTVLPALLAKLGNRADRRALRRAEAGKRVRRPAGTSQVWGKVLSPAIKHPAITLTVSVLIMLGMAAPALGLKMRDLDSDTFPRSIPAVQTYDRLTAAFPDLLVQDQVVVRSDAAHASAAVAALEDLGRRAQADPVFAKDVQPQVQTSKDGTVSSLVLSVPFGTGSSQARKSLDLIQHDYLPATVGKVPGAESGVTGNVARDDAYLQHQDSKLPLVIGFLLLLTFVMTVAVFRSVVIGLLGIVLNMLSAAAAFGLLVVVFQGSWAQGLLGFHSTGVIGSRVPLFLFVILFGLSMDYQVFVVSRIREAALNGVSTRQAVLDGVSRSAGVVTSAAVVMVTVFASFVFLSLVEMKEIGFSLAVAVLLDAFIVRIMILPSALTLLGKASWWPSRAVHRAQQAPAHSLQETATAHLLPAQEPTGRI